MPFDVNLDLFYLKRANIFEETPHDITWFKPTS